jgi:hypothetical protein
LNQGIGIAGVGLFLAFALQVLASAQAIPSNTNANLVAYFLSYNVPKSIIYNSTYLNQSIGASTYSLMLLRNGSFIVTNTTASNYHFIINNNTAAYALAPYIFYKYYPNSTDLAYLTSLMQLYRKQIQPALQDCLNETGLNRYLCKPTDSVAYCLQNSCSTVPNCNRAIKDQSAAGESAIVGGLLNFSYEYQSFNSTYYQYLSTATTINRTNVGVVLPALSTLADQMASESTALTAQNPIFPLPQAYVGTAGNVCGANPGYGSPWYCFALGFCEFLTFNQTTIGTLQGELTTLQALPLNNASIQKYGKASASLAYSYYWPVEQKREAIALGAFLNATTKPYRALAANLSFVSSRYKNASVSNALINLVSTYNSIVTAGGGQNFTNASQRLSKTIANATVVYQTDAVPYLRVYNTAFNNTAMLTVKQLDYSPVPYQVAFLATQQADLNYQLNGQINSITLATLAPEVQSVSSQVSSILPVFSLGVLTKEIYGGAINALLYNPVAVANPANPASAAYVALFAFAEGIIVFLLVYFLTYHRLNRKGRIQKHPKAMRAWMLLFGGLFALVIIYTVSAYAIAGGANTFLPASSFISSLGGSSRAYIMVNSTVASSTSISQCTNALQTELAAAGKNVTLETYTANYSCKIGSVNGPGCFGSMLSSGTPTVVITGGGSSPSIISYYGLYGTALFAGGSLVMGQSCELATILKPA